MWVQWPLLMAKSAFWLLDMTVKYNYKILAALMNAADVW